MALGEAAAPSTLPAPPLTQARPNTKTTETPSGPTSDIDSLQARLDALRRP